VKGCHGFEYGVTISDNFLFKVAKSATEILHMVKAANLEEDNIVFETAELHVENNIREEVLDRIDDIEWSSMEWENGESNVTQNISEHVLDIFGYDAEWNGMEWEIVEMNEEHNSWDEVTDMYGNDAEFSSMECISHIPKSMLKFVGNCRANLPIFI
jgi:hypothetical protein